MLRIVADTNILVSRLLQPRSLPAQVVRLALDQHTLLISDYLLAELASVLRKPKLAKLVTDEERIYFLTQLAHYAEPVHPPAIVPLVCRDPKDDAILALAVAGQATHLVTGDADLLTLHPFQGIPILTPAQFLEL